jgi:septal ring-binding cell division protein DamX
MSHSTFHPRSYLKVFSLGCMLCLAGTAFGKSSSTSNASHRFSPPTALDSLLDANAIPLPSIKPADVPIQMGEDVPTPAGASEDAPTSEARTTAPAVLFQIQLDALSDIDSAQARKAVLEQTLGSKIDMVFDPPFYKLRYGSFSSKQEAEDALADLAEKNMQGFVVRQ